MTDAYADGLHGSVLTTLSIDPSAHQKRTIVCQ